MFCFLWASKLFLCRSMFAILVFLIQFTSHSCLNLMMVFGTMRIFTYRIWLITDMTEMHSVRKLKKIGSSFESCLLALLQEMVRRGYYPWALRGGWPLDHLTFYSKVKCGGQMKAFCCRGKEAKGVREGSSLKEANKEDPGQKHPKCCIEEMMWRRGTTCFMILQCM